MTDAKPEPERVCLTVIGTTLYDLRRHTSLTDRLFDNVRLWQSLAIGVWLTFAVRMVAKYV